MASELLPASGLQERDQELIVNATRSFPEIDQLILFGSRAKGDYKPGSDIDLAIKGRGVTYDIVVQLSGRLNEETPLPYFFDVVNYADITETKLVDHIDRIGITLYCKDATGRN